MHNNFYFLNWLTKRLYHRLLDTRLIASYSQEREILILHFLGQRNIYLQAYLRSDFTCLTFPEVHHRAKRNSADLFPELIGATVSDIVMIRNDRSFYLTFDNGHRLLFKMHGNRSNLILIRDGTRPVLFNNSLKADHSISIDALSKPNPTKQQYIDSEGNLQKLFPVLGAELINYLQSSLKKVADVEEGWKLLSFEFRRFEEVTKCYISQLEDLPRLSLLESSDYSEFDDPIEALNFFYSDFQRKKDFIVRKRKVLSDVNKEIGKTTTYISKTSKQLSKLSTGLNDADIADLVMANLDKFKPGHQVVQVQSFDETETVTIRIKEGTTPIKYAQNLYRKSKNRRIELETMEGNLRKRELALKKLLARKGQIEASMDIKSIQGLENTPGSKKDEIKQSEYLEFEHDGFTIKVGRNAKNNDKLTFVQGYKEDLWLHVKDTKGSHVLLKYRSDRNFPKRTIEKAAQLAAWFSKRKTESIVPVIFTPRKYVRKRKGDPPGAVVVEKEEVILVEPEKW